MVPVNSEQQVWMEQALAKLIGVKQIWVTVWHIDNAEVLLQVMQCMEQEMAHRGLIKSGGSAGPSLRGESSVVWYWHSADEEQS